MSVVAIPADEIVELMLEAPPGQVVKYNHDALCSALGITDDPARMVVETNGRQAIVTIYPSNPLAVMPAPTLDDMLMDRHGRIVVGRHHNGRPARRRMFDKRTGSAQRGFVLGTTGAGKSRLVQYYLACEKRNRVVSLYGDLKGGQSAPESENQVDWRATSQEENVLMLRSAVRIVHARQRRYAALGRNAFLIGQPDPLVSVRIDEANRGLERGAPYRDEMAYLIKELGRTGRSVGVGIELDAQAGHLEELGGSDTLRAMLKEGDVVLLRWSSQMMAQLVQDGLLPAGVQLTPIRKQLKPYALRSQFDAHDDDDDFCDTQGMAYLLSSSTPTSLMRHWRIGSIEPTPGLDPEILALYGPGEPARLEESSWGVAGAAYAARNDPAAMAALCQALRDEYTEKKQQAQVTGASRSAGGGRKIPLKDRVLAALAATEGPLTVQEILDAVNQDGGREIKAANSVRTVLSELVDNGDVANVGRNLYALNR